MTKILPCTCGHPFQDERYGKGKRVHNNLVTKSENENWRCTVCKSEISSSGTKKGK